jgi:hypothetical protein
MKSFMALSPFRRELCTAKLAESDNVCYSNYSKRNGAEFFSNESLLAGDAAATQGSIGVLPEHTRTVKPQRRPAVGLRGGRYLRYSAADLLAARTDRGPSCWLVTGYAMPNGYVQVDTRDNGTKRRVYAHRLAYELVHGPIPAGLSVLHSCDNPRCVNPAHLSVGTQRDNVHDAIRKGRFHAHYRSGARLDGRRSGRKGRRG